MAAPPAPDRWERLKTLVETALDQPVDGRATFLRTIEPPSLAAEVTDLVTAYDQAEASGRLTSALAAEPTTGDRVGPYRVLGRLGTGGMGAVYRAERIDGRIDRTVALKVVRHASPDLARRFDRECRVLALLEHPHIARLYDADVSDDGGPLGGTPYLAMELVNGEPITDAADRLDLGVEGRVRLVLQVCAAVGYAHGRLVLHRDLKPSNVLVTETASGPRAVVLDFGIAKLLGDENDVLTRTGSRAYTPAYAAPEQLAGADVTTATDVYGVGALLYELLADARPYDLADATAADAERRKAEPPRPPSAVASLNRARSLRGDLDTICLKALDPDPERRYLTADALADDLRRHLDGLPVQARPATVGYRAGRFVRRHRTGVAAAALVALALVVGLSVALWQSRVAQTERDHARRAATEAEAQTERAEAVAGFLEQILRAPNTNWYVEGEAKGPETPVRAVLDEAAARVDRDFADRPDLLADLHHLLGDTYAGLGLVGEARRHHARVLALRESLYTPPDPRLAEALFYAASFLPTDSTRAKARMLERAVAMQRARPEGNNFPFIIEILGHLYIDVDREAEADTLFAEGIAFAEAHFVPDSEGARYRDRIVASLRTKRADALLALGRLGEAERQLDAADSVMARLPRTGGHYVAWRDAACSRGRLLRLRSQFARAEPLLHACAGEPPPRGVPSPFRASEGTADSWSYWDSVAGTQLVALYEAWSRPAEAAPYRAGAASYRAHRDSVRAAFRTP